MPPIAYKLRSLSDLPGLILQVAGTPTHGVLVSDRIGACPYCPFSSLNYTLTLRRNLMSVAILIQFFEKLVVAYFFGPPCISLYHKGRLENTAILRNGWHTPSKAKHVDH